jgi:hypothetical protein
MTAGVKNNTTSAVASNEGGTGETASANLSVVEPIAAVPALGPISWVALTILLAAAGYFAVKNALR